MYDETHKRALKDAGAVIKMQRGDKYCCGPLLLSSLLSDDDQCIVNFFNYHSRNTCK